MVHRFKITFKIIELDLIQLDTCVIHYGTQLKPSIGFLKKIGDIGMFVYKIN